MKTNREILDEQFNIIVNVKVTIKDIEDQVVNVQSEGITNPFTGRFEGFINLDVHMNQDYYDYCIEDTATNYGSPEEMIKQLYEHQLLQDILAELEGGSVQ